MRNLRLEDLSNVSKIIGAGAKAGLKPGVGSPEPMQPPSHAAAAQAWMAGKAGLASMVSFWPGTLTRPRVWQRGF